MSEWKPDICIYHFPCDDGFAAAWVAKKKWPDITLAPTNYGQAFPDVDISGKNVLIADFSYKPDALLVLAKRAASVVVLDHHKTARADLEQFNITTSDGLFRLTDVETAMGLAKDRVAAHFDMDRSGAMLTWNFCFPDEAAPVFIQFIEDRDLWRFRLKETRAFSLYLRSFPYDLDVWSNIAHRLDFQANAVIWEAEAIERFYDQKLAEMLPTATLKTVGKWSGVPVAHAPYAFASDLAHELLKAHPQAPFAAVVVDAYGGRTYSLRSEDSRQDVSEVAKTFGGGGHRNAAGFRVPL